MSKSQATHDYGPKPKLSWLPVSKLSVDLKYQRDTGSSRSKALIKKIIDGFRWPRFGVVLVIPNGDAWHVIDGQHRVEAAKALKITEVPCLVLPHTSPAEAAADFVALNRDRVTVNAYQIYHSELAAKAPVALGIDEVCKATKISIPRYQVPMSQLKEGQTLAIGTIRRLVALKGVEDTIKLIKAVIARHGRAAGAVCAPTIREVALEWGYLTGKLSQQVRNTSKVIARKGMKVRYCLMCRNPFNSTGKEERICPNCKQTSTYKESALD